jgi:alpha-beta hydrolase superfamily lysophospholipase
VSIGCRFYVAAADAPAILFFHGNGEIAADYDEIAPAYNLRGINFLAAEYRGYGRSGGTPTAGALLRDAHFTLKDIMAWRARQGHTGPLFVMGRSLGSVPALELAAACPGDISGLIIESGFAYSEPLLRVLGVQTRELGITEADCFASLEKIQGYRKPLLVIHAQRDQFIPVSDAQALVRACPAERRRLIIIPGADHNSILRFAGSRYFDDIKSFIQGQ